MEHRFVSRTNRVCVQSVFHLWLGNGFSKQKPQPCDRGFVNGSGSDYFIRSKFFWRICQSGSAANFSRFVETIFASFAFFVGRLTL